ncbi:hypothetical protein CDLVIII_1357 [Clostridium sp. DL-VIII]|uniref:hypothetical protein n=1 Tax=Clostridium sp. DL-VIII TaxID=641107 RepID=UPI00023AF84C|nr:hypothetical protein [Clostridium sp. DL-VIII]EHI98056.1 hypothetical protein CDLVIII_1357 [Clostridium sp. DL-VIII]
MRKVLKIDDNGFFIEDVLLENKEITPDDCIEINCPVGFYKPKWDGDKWVEGLTKEELNVIKNKTIQPTQEEILRAKLIKDNANIQLLLTHQQQINANLLSQIAKLGGAK